MRILHLVDLANIGGVERIFSEFIAVTSPYPAEHFVLSESNNISEEIRKAILGRVQLMSVRDYGKIRIPKCFKRLRKQRREHCIKSIRPDVIVVWNHFIDVNFPTNCPVIYYEHGGAWYSHRHLLVQRFFAQVTAVIAVSHAAERVLQLKYQIKQPIYLRKNVLLDSTLPKVPVTPRGGLSRTRPVRLGCAGRLVPVKCMGLVVLATKVLKEKGVMVKTTIAGAGKERKALERLIDRHHLHRDVELIGLQKNLDDFYQNTDIYLCASAHESFGLTCLEAAAWGVPVIAGKADGMVESVRDGVTGICVEPTLDIESCLQMTGTAPESSLRIYWPDTDTVAPAKVLDPEKIADTVMLLLDDPALYQKFSQQALAMSRAQEQFAAFCFDLYRIFDEQVT